MLFRSPYDNENVFFVKVPSKSEAEFLRFQMIPEIIVAITMAEYNSIPSKIEFLIPPPTPETTNARDGFEQSGKSRSYSSYVIRSLSYNFFAICAPNGNPQTFPIRKGIMPMPQIENVFLNPINNFELLFTEILFVIYSDKIMKGNIAGIIEERHSLSESCVDFRMIG